MQINVHNNMIRNRAESDASFNKKKGFKENKIASILVRELSH